MTDKPRTRRLALTLINGQPRLCDEQTGELIEGVESLSITTGIGRMGMASVIADLLIRPAKTE